MRWLGTPSGVGVAIALVVVLAAGIFADVQNRVLHQAQLEAEVQGELSLVRARLEGKIAGNIQLVRGLVAVIGSEPDLDQPRFEELAEATLAAGSQLRHLAVAPDLVVSMVYPQAGNEAALGLDYRANPQQRELALRARDSAAMVLAGPVALVQGGTGLIGRFPVFAAGPGETQRFWGIVSAVIDLERLYDDSGVTSLAGRRDLAIVGADGRGAAGSRFYGPATVFEGRAVVEEVQIPGGTWLLAARPKGGWPAEADNAWLLRSLVALAGFVIIVPIVISGRLLDERQAHLGALQEAKADLEHNALHDPLTGLPNRRYLDEVMARLAGRPGDGRRLGLLHIDLDRFKQINDTLGHAAGDAMLVHAAKVLVSNVRAGDFVARIGGDEFVVLCHGEGDDTMLGGLAERIVTQMRLPVDYRGQECRFGVSVGIASEAARTANPGQLLINADIALYRAKRRGRNRYEFFTAALQEEVVHTKRLADEILQGLERGEFVPWFQPQFDAWSLDVTGLEALVRWNHPTRGLLSPGHFLAVAEELNVVASIDRLVLEQSLEHFNRWRASGLAVPRLSVNVSARRLADEALLASLRNLPITPGTLSFELVESIFLDTTDDAVGFNVDRIKALGIDIEIDDFGSGHASIVGLLKLKPARFKIDRQLVMPIVDSAAQRHLVGSIIDIGKSLDIDVVAEGTETMAHAAVLRALGCDVLQGYALARPMPAAEIAGFLAQEKWRQGPRRVEAAVYAAG